MFPDNYLWSQAPMRAGRIANEKGNVVASVIAKPYRLDDLRRTVATLGVPSPSS